MKQFILKEAKINEYQKGCWGRWCARLLVRNKKLKAKADCFDEAARLLDICYHGYRLPPDDHNIIVRLLAKAKKLK